MISYRQKFLAAHRSFKSTLGVYISVAAPRKRFSRSGTEYKTSDRALVMEWFSIILCPKKKTIKMINRGGVSLPSTAFNSMLRRLHRSSHWLVYLFISWIAQTSDRIYFRYKFLDLIVSARFVSTPTLGKHRAVLITPQQVRCCIHRGRAY